MIGDPATDLAISVLNPDGTVSSRWGADEDAVGDIPRGLTFTTSDPGGFKDASLALSRDIDVEWPDLRLLRSINIYGRGERTAWEGRLHEIPSHQADDFSINPGAVGHVARLDDDPSFAEIYIDRDLSRWGEMTTQRKLELTKGGNDPSAVVMSATTAGSSGAEQAGITAQFQWVKAGKEERGELLYYSGGPSIGQIMWDLMGRAAEEDATFFNGIFLSSDGVKTDGAEGFSHAITALEKSATAAANGFPYAVMTTQYGGVTVADPYIEAYRWQNLVVLGRHGLTKRGAWPTIGLYGSDVIADIVRRTAPDLKYTTGADGTIADSTFAIPHLAFPEGVKGSDAVLGVNAFHQRSWGVYDDKTFFWRPPTSYRKRWRIRRSRGHGVDLLGPQADDAVNGVVVSFTDPGGVERVVGPPGCATAFATSEALADTSATNPVNLAGIERKWGELKLGFVTTTAGAIQVGGAWLQEKLASASSRGSVVVSGLVEDDATGTLYPSWAMRAGDSAVVTDGDNVERGIIDTSYDHDTRTCTCNLDATPHKVEALMERMGIVLVGVVD